MNCENLSKLLQSEHFTLVINKGKKFEKGAMIYAKEIKENIFLLFVILKNAKVRNVHAFIASFDCAENIGIKDPVQLMFYQTITEETDLDCFKRYISVPA